MSRGIVVLPRFKYSEKQTVMEMGFRKSDLWFYLTYWDHVVFPVMPSPFGKESPIRVPGEFEGLELIHKTSGSIFPPDGFHETHGKHIPYFPPNPFQSMLIASHEYLDESEPGLWSIGRSGGNFEATSATSAPIRTIEFELYDALPTPGPGVPLEDVLDHKGRRQAELDAVRAYLDELYLYASNCKDLPRAKSTTLEKLEKALEDAAKVAHESFGARVLNATWGSIDIGTVTTFGMSVAAGQPELGAALTLAQGTINFVARLSNPSTKPVLAYVQDLPSSQDNEDQLFGHVVYDDVDYSIPGRFEEKMKFIPLGQSDVIEASRLP